jgi:GNAT superfamily N-acetyltransferase
MKITILPVNKSTLAGYSTIPSYVEVTSILDVKTLEGFGGIAFNEEKVKKPYLKNYDEHGEPFSWLSFNTSNWLMFIMLDGEIIKGGLTVACKTPGLRILNGRDDLADVWDIRVHPEYQRRGIGTKLFQRAIKWSRRNGYRQLCVETQNVNVKACRFYLKQGCTLGAVNRYAYHLAGSKVADEAQLIWFIDL